MHHAPRLRFACIRVIRHGETGWSAAKCAQGHTGIASGVPGYPWLAAPAGALQREDA